MLRHNPTQELLADIHTVSQSTISRVVAVYTPLIAELLQAWIPQVEDLDPDRQYIIDGTLAPCWSWHDRPELYSGKHHTTGVNLHVACTLAGHLAWISPALPGSVHDAKAIKESGFLAALDSQSHIGDKGYIGLGMITPVKKPAHGELTDSDRRNNTIINRVHYLIERVIANLKTWRVLHTDYRRPYNNLRNHNTSRHGTHLRLHPMNKPHCDGDQMKTRRRRYLVAYDIREPGRLRRICKLMEAHGERLQYSVFICDLNKSELIHLRAAGERIMNLTVDSVVIVDLGDIGEDRFIFVGHHEELPTRGPQIV